MECYQTLLQCRWRPRSAAPFPPICPPCMRAAPPPPPPPPPPPCGGRSRRTSSLKYLPKVRHRFTSHSIAFRRKDVKLIGLNSLALMRVILPFWEWRPPWRFSMLSACNPEKYMPCKFSLGARGCTSTPPEGVLGRSRPPLLPYVGHLLNRPSYPISPHYPGGQPPVLPRHMVRRCSRTAILVMLHPSKSGEVCLHQMIEALLLRGGVLSRRQLDEIQPSSWVSGEDFVELYCLQRRCNAGAEALPTFTLPGDDRLRVLPLSPPAEVPVCRRLGPIYHIAALPCSGAEPL